MSPLALPPAVPESHLAASGQGATFTLTEYFDAVGVCHSVLFHLSLADSFGRAIIHEVSQTFQGFLARIAGVLTKKKFCASQSH